MDKQLALALLRKRPWISAGVAIVIVIALLNLPAVLALAAGFFLIALYFFPSIVVLKKRQREPGPVVVINVFFGWTVIGWIVALAMATGYDGLWKTNHDRA